MASLAGVGRAGVATITVIAGDLTATAEVVLFGPVDRIEASSEQGSIEIGGSTFVVVTAPTTPATTRCRALSWMWPARRTARRTSSGPADKSVLVNGDNNVDKNVNGDNQLVDKGDIPALVATT